MKNIADDVLNGQVEAAEARLRQLREEQGRLAARIAAEVEQLGALRDEVHRRKLANAQALHLGTDWAYLLQETGSQEQFRAANKALEALGLMSSGYNPETMQRSVRIAMTRERTGEIEQLARSLETVMPHVKAHADGWAYFSILEHSLSASGSFKLRFRPDGSAFECVHYPTSRGVVEKITSTLRDMLAYIQVHHFYE